ncbi:CD177 antigen, partial [Thomomys bottae]
LALPLSWAAGQKTCEPGEGCQDTLIIIENGPKVNLVLTKGCTVAEDQEARITRHRAGPGLSILSYHHVCRQADFCNTLSTTEALGALSTSTAQGTLRCPICFSRGQSCPKDTPKQTCPAGHTHCYDGVLRLTGGGIFSRVWVQGCLPRPGCNLLNGTQTIGVMDVSESCGASRSAAQALECQLGTLETVRNISELPLQWTAGHRTCEVGEGCQDTLMIVENGPQVYLALSKGCTTAQDQAASVTEHRLGPGLSTISYSLVCRHGDFCNALSNTVPLWAPPPATAQGTLSCPICFSRGQSCPKDTPKQTCPAGHTHCYDGVLRLTGGGIFSRVWVQGCLPRPGCNLLNGTQTIGAMDVSESCRTPRSDGVMCYQGSMQKSDKSFSQTPTKWMVNGIQECSVTEVCQETLLLVNSGPETFLAGSKGCGEARRQESPISIYSQSPGILVASYSHFCSSNLCNRIKSTDVLLFSLQSGMGCRVSGDPRAAGRHSCVH